MTRTQADTASSPMMPMPMPMLMTREKLMHLTWQLLQHQSTWKFHGFKTLMKENLTPMFQ
jgi:hypothetical protein